MPLPSGGGGNFFELVSNLHESFFIFLPLIGIGLPLTVLAYILIAVLNLKINEKSNENIQEHFIDWKKNILTKILAVIYFGGLIFGYTWIYSGDMNGEFAGLAIFFIYVLTIFPASFMGFIQILISIIRWKKLATLDKIIFSYVSLGLLLLLCMFTIFPILSYIDSDYQNEKILEQTAKHDNPNLCGKIIDNDEWNSLADSCYRSFAIKRQDPNLCPFNPLDPGYCYEEVLDLIWGKGLKNKEDEENFKAVCLSLKHEYNRDKCFLKIGITPSIENPSLETNSEAVNLLNPKDLSAKFFGGGSDPFVQLTFDYSVADYFNIYRSINPDGPWELVSADFPSYAHSFVDYNFPKNAEALYYRITASDGEGNEGPYSPVANINLP